MGVELHPKSLDLHRLLGILQSNVDNVSSAIEAFESALKLKWQYNYQTGELNFDLESAFLAANLYLTSKTNLTRAEELFRSLLATGNDYSQMACLVGLGQVLMLKGDEDDARTYLLKAAGLATEGSDVLKKIEELMAGK